MTGSKDNSGQISRWRTLYRRAAGAFGLLAALAAGVAALTGNLSSIGQFAKSWLYPTLPELVLIDSRFVESPDRIVRSLDLHEVDPHEFFAIVIETVVEKKSGPGVQHCNAEFLGAENRLFNSTDRTDPNVHDYSFRAGGEQRRLQFHFDIRRKDSTKQAKLRLVCKGIITQWNPVSGMPQFNFPVEIVP
jgi:hypothetical protein